MLSIIQEYSNHLEEIFENSFDYIYLHDKNGNILDVNNIIVRNLGYSKQEILKMNVNDFIFEEDIPEVSRLIKRTIETGIVNKPKIYKVKKKDGNFVYIENSTIPLKKNKKIYAILGIGHEVTRLKETEGDLIESEEKYHHLFSKSPMHISLFDMKGNLIESNRSILKKLEQYANLDFTGKNFIDIATHFKNSKQIIKLFLSRFKDLRKGKTLEPIEFFLITKEDKKIWLRWHSSIVEIKNREYIQVIIQDITEQKEIEQNLKESEEKYRLITENANDLIRVLNDRFEIEFANEKAHLNVLGYQKEDLLGKPAIFFNDPDDYTSIRRYLRKVFKTGEGVHESRVRHKNDHWIWFEIKFKIFHDENGNIKYLNISRDITERKKNEKKLRESEEKFRNIAEQTFMGIIIIQKGKIKYANKALSKISGYPLGEILSWTQKEFVDKIHPDDLETILKRLQRNIKSSMSSFSRNTFRIIRKDNEIRWLEDYTTRILYQGKPANLISIVDVTDKQNAEQLIIEENKRLLELHELRKDLITRVSHELKTPMTSIYGAIQILIKLYMDEIGQEAQKYVKIGHRGSLRLKQLIDNLLDISRLDSKKLILHLQNENLVELLVDCVKDMKYLANTRQQRLQLDFPNDIFIKIDRLRFRQVISNIISNAIKNTPKKGKIFISLVDKNKFLDIRIKDTGVGLTKEEKDKLFEKFGKIERYGMNLDVDIEGSGLGLFISKEIVELHNGQIIVESEGRNKGSTFIIRLPQI